jgi:hypothetical protein
MVQSPIRKFSRILLGLYTSRRQMQSSSAEELSVSSVELSSVPSTGSSALARVIYSHIGPFKSGDHCDHGPGPSTIKWPRHILYKIRIH